MIFTRRMFLAPAVAALALAAAPASAADDATYTMTWTPMWTMKSHPFEYPKAGVLTGPHMSGIIGASHDGSFMLFKEGMMPTMGLERLSEEGKHSPLDAEIKSAIGSKKAGMLFESDAIKDFSKSTMVTVKVDRMHSMVGAVAMIAPSPDWFAGLDVDLMENGQWVAEKTVDVYAWDSGGDDGMTYMAADKDNNPKKPTMMSMSKQFTMDGKPVPVAKVTFKKK